MFQPIDESRVLTFPKGILGFSERTRFAILDLVERPAFHLLQSIDSPDLSFIVTEPRLFVDHYHFRVTPEQCHAIGAIPSSRFQFLAIVNKVDNTLTMNLQGPIIINLNNRQAMQIALPQRQWHTRHTIVQLGTPAAACGG